MRIYIALILINLYYAFISIVTKLTSQQSFLSFKYVMGVCVTVLMWKKRRKLLQLKRRCCYSFDVAKLMFFS